MLPAILTAILFAFSAVVSQRATRIFGALPANAYRLCIACAVLGLITLATDATRGTSSLHSELFGSYYWSGLIGFGIGDIALFLAYARLGSRLTILLNWCAAALVAAAGDLWLRAHGLTLPQCGGVAAIMAGLLVALWPSGEAGKKHAPAGYLWALLAGVGMGMGTVISGLANDQAQTLGVEVYGISQAFQRSTAGVTAALAALMVVSHSPLAAPAKPWKHKPFWLIATALCGPVAGVSCYQWAQLELRSSATVVAIAATSTLLVIPLAKLMERDAPSPRQIAGTVLAAAGIILLKLYS